MFTPVPKPAIEPLTRHQKYILIGLIAAAAALFYIIRNLYFISLGGASHLDIATFHAAAEAVFTGKSSPYSLPVLQLYKPQNLLILYPYLYLPSALPFFWPLAGHDFTPVFLAALYGNAVLLFLLIVAMALWAVRLTGSFWAAFLLIPILTEGSRGLWATLWYGQVNAVIAILLIGTLWSINAGKKAIAGILLGATITLKIYPAILLPWLALRRDWVTLGWSIGTIAALAVLTWLWLPHYLWTDWFNKVALYGYGTQPPGLMPAGHMGNLSLHGMLMRSLPDPGQVKIITASLAVLLGALGLYSAYRRPQNLPAQFAALIWLTLLIAPFTWLSHLTYALFIPVVFLAWGWNERRYIWCAVFAAIYAAVLPLTQVDYAIPLWRENLPCLGLLALWCLMQYQLWRKPRMQACP